MHVLNIELTQYIGHVFVSGNMPFDLELVMKGPELAPNEFPPLAIMRKAAFDEVPELRQATICLQEFGRSILRTRIRRHQLTQVFVACRVETAARRVSYETVFENVHLFQKLSVCHKA